MPEKIVDDLIESLIQEPYTIIDWLKNFMKAILINAMYWSVPMAKLVVKLTIWK